MPTRIRRLALLVAAAGLGAAGFSLTGCNAVEGLGTDLQESSENVREAVRDDDDSGSSN